MGGKNDSSGRTATKEQLRVAQITRDVVHDEDRGRILKLIREIIETTRCTASQAEIALFDADNNVEVAVNAILESNSLDTWTHQKTKKDKKKAEPAPRDKRVPPRNGQVRRGAPRPGQNGTDGVPPARPFRPINGEGAEGKPERRRPQQDRPHKPEQKDEPDDSWKNGPRVFQRTDVADPVDSVVPPLDSQVAKPAEPVKCAAGPLSFAAVVARQPKKEVPKVVEQPAETIPGPEEIEGPDSAKPEQVQETTELAATETVVSPKPVQPPTPVSFNNQVESVDQSLTDKLKNDLGLGASIHTSPSVSKEPDQAPKVAVEWASDLAPSEVTFDFAGGITQSPAREPPVPEQRQPEPPKAEVHAPSAHTEPPVRPQHVIGQYSAPQIHNRQQRPGNLSFSDTSSVNYQPQSQDIRSNGTNSSPTKMPQAPPQQAPIPQNTNQPSQQISQPSQPQQTAQNHHAHQQQQQQPPLFQHTQMPYNFPYMGMYPYQFGLGQMDFNALGMMPQLTVTSAGPMPGVQSHHQQPQHHQNQQQPGHQRNDHYDVNKYNSNPLNSVAGSQNNGVSNQNQPNSQLNQPQQRQPILDNGSQNITSVGPPPGFSAQPSIQAPAPFVPQQNLNSLFSMPPYNPQLQFPFLVNQKLPPQVYQAQVEEQDVRLNQQQQKMYNPAQDKFAPSNGSKDRNGGQGGQNQMGNYVPPAYNNVGGNPLLGGNKKNYSHQSWNANS